MSNYTLDAVNSKQQSPTTKTSIKLLVFDIGKLTLALPVAQVIKVIKYLPLYGSGTSYINLTHVGEQEITVVDLHQKLFKIGLDDLGSDRGYFILTKPRPITIIKDGISEEHPFMKESFGIRVLDSPSLIDVDLSLVRALPNSYRFADTLEIASHVAVVSQPESTSAQATTKTIFILDLECLV